MGNCSGVSWEEGLNVSNFFNRGVSVKILKDVLKEYEKVRDQECFILKPSGESRSASNGERLVELVVKKSCVNDKCSYVEYLGKDSRNREELGKCNIFISHAWMYDFADLVSAVEEFQTSNPNEKYYFFLDYLAVNQFRPIEDLVNLKRMVIICKSFLLVLLPWYGPIPLTRAWCIYEIASALEKGKDLIVTMPQKQEQLFMKGLMGGDPRILKVFMNLDSKNANASVLSDLEMIREEIMQNMGGFNKVDQIVGDSLRLWLMEVVFKANREWPMSDMKSAKRGNFLIQAGSFLDTQGRYLEALSMKKECVEVRMGLYGPTSEQVLTAKNNLAVSYDEVGRSAEAVTIKEDIVKAREKTLGMEHSSTLLSKNNLAVSYDNIGKPQKALILKKEILAIRKRQFGEEHDDVLISKNNLAYSLDCLGQNAEVLALNEDVYNIRLKKFGPNHPDTILSAANLANSYTNLGQWRDAVRTNIKVFNGRAKLMGQGHRDTLSSLSAVVSSFLKLKDFKMALDWAKRGDSLAKKFNSDQSVTKSYIGTINHCQSMLEDPEKVRKLQEEVRMEMERAKENPNAAIVKSILTYKEKVNGSWPETIVRVPEEGMKIIDYLQKCDSDAKVEFLWVENAERKAMNSIPHKAATMWVKSKLCCNVIKTYLPKSRTGMWPTEDIIVPVSGISKAQFIKTLDQDLNPDLYKIEDANCSSLNVILPGTSVVWMKTL